MPFLKTDRAAGKRDDPSWQLLAALLCFCVATLVAVYLAWVSLSGAPVAGCGPQSPCQRVLQSRWAYWFGIPVSIPAVLAYAALAAAARHRRRGLRASGVTSTPGWVLSLSLVAIGAAVWFGLLQALVLRSFCAFCLTAHLTATAGACFLIRSASRTRPPSGTPSLAPRIVALSLLPIMLLIAGQLLVRKQTHAVSTLPVPIPTPGDVTSGRTLALYNERFTLELAALPRIGPATAPHAVIALFDYTCPHCRAVHDLLVRAQQRFGDQLLIVTLPVPLDSRCNPLVTTTAPENQNACEYARLGLALWRTKPAAFAAFTAWVFVSPRPPSVEATRHYVEELVGANGLQAALADAWIPRQLQTDAALFEANSKRSGVWQLPQLMIGKALSVGEIQTLDGLLSLLHENLGLKSAD